MTTLDQALDAAMEKSPQAGQEIILLVDIGTHDEVY